MDKNRRSLWMLWRDERAISSVEYALLLAFVAAGIIVAADTLSNAVSNEFLETAILLDGDGCGNTGGGDGTGGDAVRVRAAATPAERQNAGSGDTV